MSEPIFDIKILLGRIELEQRYVKTGPGAYECQGRSKHFDGDGRLTETTEWEGLSSISNVP